MGVVCLVADECRRPPWAGAVAGGGARRPIGGARDANRAPPICPARAYGVPSRAGLLSISTVTAAALLRPIGGRLEHA
ncbi:hypothetical protein MRX96_030822 [Rhipicephalus microplus]